jgi:hypothetical protein
MLEDSSDDSDEDEFDDDEYTDDMYESREWCKSNKS